MADGLWLHGWVVCPASSRGTGYTGGHLGPQSQVQDTNGAPERLAVGQDSRLATSSLSLP